MSDSNPKALVFDVDGTLYRQSKLRRLVAYRFIRALVQSPGDGLQAFHAIRAYRHAQEMLRVTQASYRDVALAQLHLASERSGIPEDRVKQCVGRWMEREPLGLLPACTMKDVHCTLEIARRRGLRLGVFSDYPASEKLRALGILEMFDAVVSAQDPDVQRFKPDPRGIEVTIQRLGVAKEDVVYIGDRPEVDGVAAVRAGVRFLIMGHVPSFGLPGLHTRSLTYAELASTLSGTRSWA